MRLSLLFLSLCGLAAQLPAADLSFDFIAPVQPIDGFGSSSAWYADEYDDYEPAEQAAFIDFVHNPDSGLGLNIHRIRIYPSPGENNGTPVYDWKHPKLQKEAAFYKALQDAYDPIFMAVPWTPPGWMKSNNDQDNGGSLLPEYYDDYATYLAEWIIGMEREFGIEIDILSIQNEPDGAKSWESCIWSADDFITFINQFLKPEFAARSIEVKLMLNEQTNWSDNTINSVLSDATAGPQIDYAAAHLYNRSYRNPKKFSVAQNAGLRVWMTEFYYGDYNISGDFSGESASTFRPIERAVQLGKIMAQQFTFSEVNAYLYWWMMAPTDKSEEGLITSGSVFSSSTPRPLSGWEPTKWAYGFGQFSRFVRPGFDSIDFNMTNASSDLHAAAFRNEALGQAVVVLVNQSDSSDSITLSPQNYTPTSLKIYRTSESEDLSPVTAPAIGENGIVSLSLPPLSISTLIFGSSDEIEPFINLDAPDSGATFYAGEDVAFEFSHSSNITAVSAYIDEWTLIGSSVEAPFSIVWESVQAGAYTVTFRTTVDGTSSAGPAVQYLLNVLPGERPAEPITVDFSIANLQLNGNWWDVVRVNAVGGSFLTTPFNETASAVYLPGLIGDYRIELHTPTGWSRASSGVTVEVNHAEGSMPFVLNQQVESAWQPLIGTFRLNASSTIEIFANVVQDEGIEKRPMVDAIRLTPVVEQTGQPTTYIEAENSDN